MTPQNPAPESTEWPALFRTSGLQEVRALAPQRVDAGWLALGQAWRGDGVQPGFKPGWGRVEWQEDALVYSTMFLTDHATNRAREINERAWELGDVCEIFLQISAHRYLEIQVTPENTRLQLCWPPEGRAQVVAGKSALRDYFVKEASWVCSATHLTKSYWATQLTIPRVALAVGDHADFSKAHLRTAVCRYDYSLQKEPILSSTAHLRAPDFHRRSEWHRLVLQTKN